MVPHKVKTAVLRNYLVEERTDFFQRFSLPLSTSNRPGQSLSSGTNCTVGIAAIRTRPHIGVGLINVITRAEDQRMDEERRERSTITEEIELAGAQLVERIKEMVAEGNVRTVRVRTPDAEEPFLELPLTGGVVGGGVLLLAAPWLAALGALAAVVAKVKIEIVRDADDEGEEDKEDAENTIEAEPV